MTITLEEVKALLRLLRDEPDPEVEARLLEMYRRWWAARKKEGSRLPT